MIKINWMELIFDQKRFDDAIAALGQNRGRNTGYHNPGLYRANPGLFRYDLYKHLNAGPTMLPEEFEVRAARQTPEQTSERLSWEAWARVLNAWIWPVYGPAVAGERWMGQHQRQPTARLEVRIDQFGFNWLHFGVNYLNIARHRRGGKAEMIDLWGALVSSFVTLGATFGEQSAELIIGFLESPEANGLYLLELVAGRKGTE